MSDQTTSEGKASKTPSKCVCGECKACRSRDPKDDVSSGHSHGGDADSGNPGRGSRVAFDSTGDGVADDEGESSPPPSAVTWTARVLSLGMVLSLIGYLAYLIVRPVVPAQFDVEPDFKAVEQRGSQWVLPVELTNTSTVALANVVVDISQGNVTRSFTVVLMGEGEKAQAEVRLPERPTLSNITADVTSYQSP